VATQKNMGKGMLLERLTEQIRTQKGAPEDPESAARAILIKRGHMTEDGKYTEAGQKRNNMTAEERAKDRASKSLISQCRHLITAPRQTEQR
jgi:hypothetical protein